MSVEFEDYNENDSQKIPPRSFQNIERPPKIISALIKYRLAQNKRQAEIILLVITLLLFAICIYFIHKAYSINSPRHTTERKTVV